MINLPTKKYTSGSTIPVAADIAKASGSIAIRQKALFTTGIYMRSTGRISITSREIRAIGFNRRTFFTPAFILLTIPDTARHQLSESRAQLLAKAVFALLYINEYVTIADTAANKLYRMVEIINERLKRREPTNEDVRISAALSQRLPRYISAAAGTTSIVSSATSDGESISSTLPRIFSACIRSSAAYAEMTEDTARFTFI